MNRLLRNSEEHFQKYLTPNQFQTLSILIGLLNQYKEVKIEKATQLIFLCLSYLKVEENIYNDF